MPYPFNLEPPLPLSRTLLLTLSPNPSPAQALDRLRRSSEWSAFEAVVRGRIGTEWGLRTGPLHSTQAGPTPEPYPYP